MTRTRRAALVAVGSALLASPAAAHGVRAVAAGLAFPVVVGASVSASLVGGGAVLALARRRGCATDRSYWAAVCVLLLSLGGVSLALAFVRTAGAGVAGALVGGSAVYLSRGSDVTDCGTCADATLGAVTLHRALEGGVLATVYAANAALGAFGAVVLAGHAAAETAAVGSLYAGVSRRHALGAVAAVQLGFVVGAGAGAGVVDALPGAVRAGLLGFVGGVLLVVGARESYHRYGRPRPTAPA